MVALIQSDQLLPQNPAQQTAPTDCQRFADMVAEIAARNNNAEDFMNEMA
jgi:hypothetical protein